MFKHLEIKNYIIKYLAEKKAIDFYYECKHYPKSGFKDEVPYFKKDCYCRKPRTILIQDCIHEHNIDIFNSLFVGDSKSDLLAGEIIGIKTFKYEFIQNEEKVDKFQNILDEIKKFFENS